MKKNYKINIQPYEEGELYRKSMENIRISQLKKKADIEAEFRYNQEVTGTPMPHQEKLNYFQKLVDNYKESKIEYLI